MRCQVESQFDTTVVASFEAILAGADETYRAGSRRDFRSEADDLRGDLQVAVSAAVIAAASAGS